MRRGLFKPTVMFFGLTNSPATFQTMMNHLFQPLITAFQPQGTIIRIYMDDIGIATKSRDLAVHTTAVTAVLTLANKHNLYFKPEKCLFHASSMDYLGVILEKGATHMDPIKVKGVQDSTLKTVKDV
jgi:hypothetical protein